MIFNLGLNQAGKKAGVDITNLTRKKWDRLFGKVGQSHSPRHRHIGTVPKTGTVPNTPIKHRRGLYLFL